MLFLVCMHTIIAWYLTRYRQNNVIYPKRLQIFKMENLVKDFLYTGVGLVSLTAEKFQKTLDELVADRKVTKEEGEKIFEEMKKNSESKREELEAKIKSLTDDIIAKFDFMGNTEMKSVKARLAAIEAKLGIEHTTEAVVVEVTEEKAEAKKTTTKKPAAKA